MNILDEVGAVKFSIGDESKPSLVMSVLVVGMENDRVPVRMNRCDGQYDTAQRKLLSNEVFAARWILAARR
jgi:hypothetical protein